MWTFLWTKIKGIVYKEPIVFLEKFAPEISIEFRPCRVVHEGKFQGSLKPDFIFGDKYMIFCWVDIW